MRMDKKKLVAVPFVIAVLLSSLAFGYAAWMDAVTIDVTAKMGTLNVAFSTSEAPTCQEYYFNPDPAGFPERLLGEFEGKDGGSCNAYYDPDSLEEDPHTGKVGFERLVIEIHNAYPQYIVHTTFIVSNLGTIPVIIYGFELEGYKTDKAGVVECTLLWYDPDVVDVTEIVPGPIIINGAQDFKSYINKDKGRLSFMFVDETGLGNRMIKTDGVFAVLKAKVSSTAPNGLSEITVAKEGVYADYDLNKIPVTYVTGGVNVGEEPEPELRRVVFEGEAGQELPRLRQPERSPGCSQ